jgi:hypothetical protein
VRSASNVDVFLILCASKSIAKGPLYATPRKKGKLFETSMGVSVSFPPHVTHRGLDFYTVSLARFAPEHGAQA